MWRGLVAIALRHPRQVHLLWVRAGRVLAAAPAVEVRGRAAIPLWDKGA